MFWDLWRRVYLQTLVTRNKWQHRERNLQLEDLVLEIDRQARRGEWETSRVVVVFPGADGLVRAVDIKTRAGIYRRRVSQLCLLEPSSLSPARSAQQRPSLGENVPTKSSGGNAVEVATKP